MKPIDKLTIYHEKTANGYHELLVKIGEEGEVVLDGCDAGEDVRKHFGDWDYEYWLTVPREHKDTLLLYLIQERFSSVHEMKEWLEEKTIPSKFESYA